MIMSHAQQKSKKRFVLTMRNQKGQVGIFVALIFQVIFVFFAMLVNVGLVVHHKINLQQSTDLAAYYGAMKQAEMMNMMAHVNFQIRQAWKLFSWRYRVLGTFGVEQNGNGPTEIQFPVTWKVTKKPQYNLSSKNFACPQSLPNAKGMTITDVPFMCMGHNGFGDWISGNNPNETETYCKMNCDALNSLTGDAFSISKIPPVGTACIAGNCLGSSINIGISQANSILEDVCRKLGPITTQMLALYYGSYIKDTGNRKNFIWMMAKNLGLSEEEMLDIDGNKVITGVRNTLRNNLTEANATSMTNDNTIVAYNGVKAQGGGTSFAESMLREITFQRLMFYLIDCEYISSNSNVKIKSLYQPGTNNLDANILSNLTNLPGGAASAQGVADVMGLNSEQVNTIGYEKNPWIHVYYGVKATSEPKIPFLPLAKIKLHAISFAKPFGGTIGPWYYKNWPSGSPQSGTGNELENRTDYNLPVKTVDSLPPNPTLKGVREFLPNYSTYVGDRYSNDNPNPDPENKGGLANTNIVAFYHLLLANKYGVGNVAPSSSDKSQEPTMRTYGTKPQFWPRYTEWYHLNSALNATTYDPLANSKLGGPRNSYMRDIELSVVSPNQFDVTYYSIEPDFFKNYLERMRDGDAIQKIKTVTGTPDAPVFPTDFGNDGGTTINGIPKAPYYSVRNQMQVTNELFKKALNDIRNLNGSNSLPSTALDVLATKQASLLTGWTFLNLTATGYNDFPSSDKTGGKYTMLFGTCDPTLNPWTDNYLSPNLADTELPPTPGNCVSGGRVGYSVKIISNDMVRSGRLFENLGGSGQNGSILNPVSDDFFQF